MATRFKITYSAREWRPWDLYEWCPSRRWWKQGTWHNIHYADTKEELEKRIANIVGGENAIKPSYYDEHGKPEPAWL